MPVTYDTAARQFRSAGELVSRAAVRAEIDKLTDFVKREAKTLSENLESGAIGLTDWHLAMRELLKSAHIIAASVGRGGIARMTQKDWGIVGAKIKWQYGFLQKTAISIEKGKILKALVPGRAQKYASALHITFYRAFGEAQAEGREVTGEQPILVKRELNAKESCDDCIEYAGMGFIPVDEMPSLGELECGDFCKCDLVFENE